MHAFQKASLSMYTLSKATDVMFIYLAFMQTVLWKCKPFCACEAPEEGDPDLERWHEIAGFNALINLVSF